MREMAGRRVENRPVARKVNVIVPRLHCLQTILPEANVSADTEALLAMALTENRFHSAREYIRRKPVMTYYSVIECGDRGFNCRCSDLI